MKQPKQPKQPRWWIQIIFAGFVTWAFTGLTPLLVLLGTGVVNLSHTGWGPFLLALGLSLLLTLVGFVLGVRVTLYYVFSAIGGLWLAAKGVWTDLTTNGLKLATPTPATSPAAPTPPSEPEPPDNSLRARMGEAGVRFLIWFFVPKHFRALWEPDDD
jgi:hypothetical protein